MARQFETFLQGYIAEPHCPIARLPLLPEDERHQVLVEWNANHSGPSKYECIHHVFESQVARTPDEPAIIFDRETITYRDLNKRANQLARRLRKLGVGPESLVGICSTRSTDLVVGLLGILKAGGAYVPLDSSYPAERLSFIVEDTALQVIVSQEELLTKLPPHRAQVVCLDSDGEAISTEFDTDLGGGASSDLAYLIYTSGSTGRPKGVAIEHRSAVALLEWAQTVFTTEELSGVLASTSICFDLSIFEIFVPLSCGGKIILADNALHLPTLPAADKVTLVNTVPSAMTELLRMNGLPKSVRTVNLAGEPLKPALVDEIYGQSNVTRVFDLYGPSEDTTYSTFALRRPGTAETIGRPVSNTEAYILDKNLQPLPVGVPGELYLGGAGLARGYLNRPELTAERFIPNPFGTWAKRLYRTGDLARYRSDGNLEYLGRIDQQVKIRGFRIELGEIESVINRHPSVRESVVVAHEDKSGAKNLAAYVVPRPGLVPTTLELREFLKEKLPQFMVPTFLTMLESLPLTPNGKLDRRALPEPEIKGADLCGTFVAPSNSIEQFLVKTWEEILKTQPIGVEDNFFELGGHSLLAVELFVRIESKYGKKIPLATLLQAPTIKKLASLLVETNELSLPALVPIQSNGSNPPFFCIHARGGNVLFYRDLAKRLGPDQPFYGLQMLGLDGKRPLQTRIEEMAAHYLKEIKEIQPEGPYLLGGASFGGTAAYEMAQQLLAQGEQVALLALFDTTGPDYPRPLPGTTRVRSRVYGLVRSFQHRVNSLKLLSAQERADFLRKQGSRIRVKTVRFAKRTSRNIAQRLPKKIRGLLFSPATARPWALLETEKAITKALKHYVTRPYPGRLTLFRASKQPLGIYPDPTLGWGELVTGELVIHEVPGFHGTIVAEPHVRFLAEQLKACIEEAQREFSEVEFPSTVQPEMTRAPLMTEHRVAVQV
jgi:amino acid adenylation domain-containing protein